MYNDSNSLHFKLSSWVIISIDSMYILTRTVSIAVARIIMMVMMMIKMIMIIMMMVDYVNDVDNDHNSDELIIMMVMKDAMFT